MTSKATTGMTLATGVTATAVAAVDDAFNTLKTYDWGADRDSLKPIDEAIVAAQGNAAALKPRSRRKPRRETE